ncbi:MAG: N-formylglutamate amidohydrolase [Azospirillaceae bacterium]
MNAPHDPFHPFGPAAARSGTATGAVTVRRPQVPRYPVVFASPHSGRHYPADLLEASRLSAQALRRSEDAFVDRLIAAAPAQGMPTISASFPRAYVDVNREPLELDPDMFEDPLPASTNTRSPRVSAGLGTIARIVGHGQPIYRRKLRYREAARRLETCYRPYHAALHAIIAEVVQRFGVCLLIDCHSMPSGSGITAKLAGRDRQVDYVIGDNYGAACARDLTEAAVRQLAQLGHLVTRNTPYAGGYITRHYGKPQDGIHAIQVEINRALYMDEAAIAPHAGFAQVAHSLVDLGRTLGSIVSTGEPLRDAAQ